MGTAPQVVLAMHTLFCGMPFPALPQTHAMLRAWRREYNPSREAAASCCAEACLRETQHEAPLKVPFCF